MTSTTMLHSPKPSDDAQRPLSRQARKEETRRALIESAAERFATVGMERATLDEIAARVGLTKGAIYANFRNKDELIDAVSQVYSQVTEAEPLFDADRDIAARLAALGAEAAEFLPQIAQRSAVLHLEFDLYLQRHPEKAPPEQAMFRAALEEDGRRLDEIARMRREPLPMPGAELMALIIGAMRGVSLERLRDPTTVSPEAAGRLLELLGRGLADWAREEQARRAQADATAVAEEAQ